jgi:hypothetical protein
MSLPNAIVLSTAMACATVLAVVVMAFIWAATHHG